MGHLTIDSIKLDLKGTTKEQVLAEMVDCLVGQGSIQEPSALLEALMEREGLGSTGIGFGVAIPHGRCKELTQPAVLLGRTQTDVDFDSIDGQPTRIFFLLVAPENGGSDHLHLLAKIARLMKDAKTRKKLMEMQTPEEIANLIRAQGDI
jgi:fructose-specific phosphotransferase system IIA component